MITMENKVHVEFRGDVVIPDSFYIDNCVWQSDSRRTIYHASRGLIRLPWEIVLGYKT